jgi:hypothetical protein
MAFRPLRLTDAFRLFLAAILFRILLDCGSLLEQPERLTLNAVLLTEKKPPRLFPSQKWNRDEIRQSAGSGIESFLKRNRVVFKVSAEELAFAPCQGS